MGARLLRAALTEPAQRWLMTELLRIDDGSTAAQLRETASDEIQSRLGRRPQAFVTYQHPYTRESTTTAPPAGLMRWAQGLLDALAPADHGQRVDSMLAQLYAKGGSLLPHVDADLGWGLQVSLGGTACFECLPAGAEAVRVHVRSGDVLVGAFGTMRHAVRVLQKDSAPPWWSAVDNRGRERCNVLFRQALSAERMRELAEERARAQHGMSLEELKRHTGKGESFLSAALRHTAVE